MKKVLLITTSPTVNGNGDTLMDVAEETCQNYDVHLQRIDIRNMDIHPCKGCYGCAKTGNCVQNDDMKEVLKALHECEGLIVESPVYYNCLSAQALLVLDRLCCTFACRNYVLGPKKKVAVFLTCTGSDVDEMKHHVQLITDLPSLQRSIAEERTEVFTGCVNKDTCRNTQAYSDRTKEIARWICE